MKTTNFKPKKLLALEGNVGAGKSTLQDMLCKEIQATPVPEPVNKWQSVNGNENILNLFYKDTKRWAYTFQTFAILTRLQAIAQHQATSPHDVLLLDGSVYRDGFCFAKNCYESGLMTPLEWHIYNEWFYWLIENYAPRPSGFIYLRTSPEVAYQRLAKRGSSEESGVPLSYFQALHQKHEDWLIDRKETLDSIKNVPVLVLEGDKDFQNDKAQMQDHVQRVRKFMSDLEVPVMRQDSMYTQANL